MLNNVSIPKGYSDIKERKATGSHYTPKELSDFVAKQISLALQSEKCNQRIRVADPAVGDGELLFSLCNLLNLKYGDGIEAHGFDIDQAAIKTAERRLANLKNISTNLNHKDFIDYVLTQSENNLFEQHSPVLYDAVISNPPYIRTQVLGSRKSQRLSKQFDLNGRVDLYHAFILGIAKLLKPGGILGIIVSNRFMTTKSGENVRKNILELFDVLQIWDFGDTQIFEAAVLPAVLILRKKTNFDTENIAKFTSIYSIKDSDSIADSQSVFDALNYEGVINIAGKGLYKIKQGNLNHGNSMKDVWRISNGKIDNWLKIVEANSYLKFSDIGKIKVGVKTTADKVFISSDWDSMLVKERPELLKKLTTHHVARSFKPLDGITSKWILYPHETVGGIRRAIDIDVYPKTARYLNQHRDVLTKRSYVIQAGRKWYEIWVPHDPESWSKPKIVFRDISEKPTFWLDTKGTIVNGDCYWLTSDRGNIDLLWLALAISNSSFIEAYYDHRFNNKLYSGRRRFISQYVEQFPLPDPNSSSAKRMIELAQRIHAFLDKEDTKKLEIELDNLVWNSFGFSNKKVSR